MIFPTKYFGGFSNTEGLYVFYSTPLFIALFGVWVAMGVLLSSRVSFVKASALSMFTSIVFGVLAFRISPLGYDHNYDLTLAPVAYLMNSHHITSLSLNLFGYLVYPGLVLETISSNYLVPISLQETAGTILVVLGSLIGYVIFRVSFFLSHDKQISIAAVMTFFTASYAASSLMTLFFPSTFGYTLLASPCRFLQLQWEPTWPFRATLFQMRSLTQ